MARWFLGCVVLGTLAVLSFFASDMTHAADPAATPDSSRAFDTDFISYQGLLLPEQEVVLQAPIEGVLKTLKIKEGDRVKRGDVLLVMDDRVQAGRVAVAKLRAELEAELERAGLAAEEAKISWEMVQRAFEQDAASDWEVRRAKLQLDQQRATIEALKEEQVVSKAMLAYEQAGLDQYTLDAPFDGEVVEVATEEGATLRREDPVLSLVAMSPLRAELRLPVTAYGELKVGQQYTLQAAAPINGEIQGELAFIDPRIDPASRTFRCVFKVANADHKLPSGVAVRLADVNQ